MTWAVQVGGSVRQQLQGGLMYDVRKQRCLWAGMHGGPVPWVFSVHPEITQGFFLHKNHSCFHWVSGAFHGFSRIFHGFSKVFPCVLGPIDGSHLTVLFLLPCFGIEKFLGARQTPQRLRVVT